MGSQGLLKRKKLCLTKPIRNTLRDTAHSQTVMGNTIEDGGFVYEN